MHTSGKFPLAHSKTAEQPQGHDLAEHLRQVGMLAAKAASRFGSAQWGYLAGIWHDLGKYRPPFQHRLELAGAADAHIEGLGARVTHSNAGALHAIEKLGAMRGRLLAALIAGHHAGLPDLQTGDGAGASLEERLVFGGSTLEYGESLAQPIPADILNANTDGLSACPGGVEGFALWQRMVFSCLVDADFLDTEAYFNPSRARLRGGHPPLAALKPAFDNHMAKLAAKTKACETISIVNRHRADVLAQCRAKGRRADLKPGFFRLTVPTGGGKTLASLAFALEHALTHGKRSIIYAIPYTSIIEQTASVFREVFATLGDELVLEHHSNLDVDERRENHSNRLATDNWDAPLIVTTNVQLFESLHAARTSRCRKLHNLVDSVIVLDEAQMLPRDFLAPVLSMLRLLVAHYGVSVVLCTATQPMLASRFEPITARRQLHGIDSATDLIDDTDTLFRELSRVQVKLPEDFKQTTPWEELAQQLRAHESVLVIVNTRKQARELFLMLDDGDAIHLSALMCAEHRSAVVKQIRERLLTRRNGLDVRPLRVISTSLVEAGVDLDFPAVYRALAGLDSIAQAAGRCNREGAQAKPGEVRVFVPPGQLPPGQAKQGAQATRELAMAGELADPLSPATFRRYFDIYYGKDADGRFDREKILELQDVRRAALRTAAEKFRLIDDEGESVIVPYIPEPEKESPVHMWLNMLGKDSKDTWARRKLQRYTVNVPHKVFERLVGQGDVEERDGLWLANGSRYDALYGLLLPDDHGDAQGYHC
ncbi:MAG: CRISPR-associated helicase Cas3' [Tahibacter sp.]